MHVAQFESDTPKAVSKTVSVRNALSKALWKATLTASALGWGWTSFSVWRAPEAAGSPSASWWSSFSCLHYRACTSGRVQAWGRRAAKERRWVSFCWMEHQIVCDRASCLDPIWFAHTHTHTLIRVGRTRRRVKIGGWTFTLVCT